MAQSGLYGDGLYGDGYYSARVIDSSTVATTGTGTMTLSVWRRVARMFVDYAALGTLSFLDFIPIQPMALVLSGLGTVDFTGLRHLWEPATDDSQIWVPGIPDGDLWVIQTDTASPWT